MQFTNFCGIIEQRQVMARQIVFYGNVSNREDTMRLVVAFAKRSTFARIYQLLGRNLPIILMQLAILTIYPANFNDISCHPTDWMMYHCKFNNISCWFERYVLLIWLIYLVDLNDISYWWNDVYLQFEWYILPIIIYNDGSERVFMLIYLCNSI